MSDPTSTTSPAAVPAPPAPVPPPATEATHAAHATEPPETYGHGADLNLPLLGTIVVAGALVLWAVVIATQAWFAAEVDQEMQTKSLGQANQPLQDLRREQLQRIQTYRWVDQGQGVVAIPVDRAMDLVVAEGRRR